MERQTFIIILLSVFIALLGIGIIVPVMPVFARELGASGFALGMIIAAFSVSRGILQPIIGNLSDKLGRMLNELEHAHIFIARQEDRLSQQDERIARQDAQIAELTATRRTLQLQLASD